MVPFAATQFNEEGKMKVLEKSANLAKGGSETAL
jgi:hypothetical protein